MRSYLLSELQKAWIWYKKIVSIFAQWIFQAFLRLLILCVTLYLVGGGCFLKAWRESKEPQKHIVMPAQYGAGAGYESSQQTAVLAYREKPGKLQSSGGFKPSDAVGMLRSARYLVQERKLLKK